MDVKKNIYEYLDYKGISPTKAERQLNWSVGSLVKAKSITSDRLKEFILLFNDVSPEWLLTGEGSMLKNEQSTPSSNQSGERSINATYHGNFTKPIHTEINSGDNVTFGGKKKLSSPKAEKISGIENDFHKYQIENDYLIKRVESLEKQLEDAIIEKKTIMNLLDKLINK